MLTVDDIVMATTNDRHWWVGDVGIIIEIPASGTDVLVNFANNPRVCRHGVWWVNVANLDKFPNSIGKRLIMPKIENE